MNIAEITQHLTDLKARCEAGAAKIVNAGNLEFFNGYALGVQHALEILIAHQSAEDAAKDWIDAEQAGEHDEEELP